jgi:hypothetical protein
MKASHAIVGLSVFAMPETEGISLEKIQQELGTE